MTSAPPDSPDFVIPKFDSTLGALYVGSGVATILYGVCCLQVFIYWTGTRRKNDKSWLRLLVLALFSLGTAEQTMMMALMYRFLITDYLNPAALPTGGPGSGEVFTFSESLLQAVATLLIQLFFCWRIWVFSALSFRFRYKVIFTLLTVSLSLFSFAANIDLCVTGFRHRLLTGNTPDFILAFKLATSSQIAYDVMVTLAMTWSLQRARSGIKRSDDVVRLITLFTINTNLLTTIISIASLVTFLTLPNATIYGGTGFLQGKTYLNSFLAVLNAREYLLERFDNKTIEVGLNLPQFRSYQTQNETNETTVEAYELSSAEIDTAKRERNIKGSSEGL